MRKKLGCVGPIYCPFYQLQITLTSMGLLWVVVGRSAENKQWRRMKGQVDKTFHNHWNIWAFRCLQDNGQRRRVGSFHNSQFTLGRPGPPDLPGVCYSKRTCIIAAFVLILSPCLKFFLVSIFIRSSISFISSSSY